MKNILGLEIIGDQLKLVCLTAAALKKEVIKADSFFIKDLSDEQTVKKINYFLENAKIKIASALCTVATDSAITKNIEIPSTNPKEIKDIVNLQVRRHTPYPREEVIVDYINIGSFQKNYTKILLVIVHRTRVDHYLRLLSLLNIDTNQISFTPESLEAIVYKMERQRVDTAPFGIIYLDKNFTEFIVGKEEKVIFTRNIPLGRDDLVDKPEQAYRDYLEEVNNSLEAYSNEDIEKELSQIVIIGLVNRVSNLKNYLAEGISLPVEEVAVGNNFIVSQEAKADIKKCQDISFDSLLSSFFVLSEAELNLVPEELKLKKTFEQRNRETIKTGILILVGLMLIVASLGIEIYTKESYLQKINSRYEPLKKEVRKLERIFSRVKAVRAHLEKRHYVLNLIEQLYELIPKKVRLSSLRYEPAGKFYIRGTAESMPMVFDFVSKMENADLFEDVKSERTTTREEEGKRLVDFRIEASLAF